MNAHAGGLPVWQHGNQLALRQQILHQIQGLHGQPGTMAAGLHQGYCFVGTQTRIDPDHFFFTLAIQPPFAAADAAMAQAVVLPEVCRLLRLAVTCQIGR